MIEQIDGLQGVLVSREFYQSLTKFYRDHYRDRVEELLWESFSGAQTAYRNVVRMIAKTNNIFRRFPRQNKQQRLDRYHLYQRYIMTFFNFAHYYQPSSEPNDHHREFRSDLRGDEQHESYNFTPDELVLQSPAMRARAQDRSNFRNCRNHTADHWRQLSRKIYNDIYDEDENNLNDNPFFEIRVSDRAARQLVNTKMEYHQLKELRDAIHNQ